MGVWKIVFLWLKGCMGIVKDIFYDYFLASNIGRNGGRGIIVHSVPDFDHHWGGVVDCCKMIQFGLGESSLDHRGGKNFPPQTVDKGAVKKQPQ